MDNTRQREQCVVDRVYVDALEDLARAVESLLRADTTHSSPSIDALKAYLYRPYEMVVASRYNAEMPEGE